MIQAQIVADSLSPQGNRLTSMLITLPRIILAELSTHRMLSKNSASSRAIPFNKMVEMVKTNPFIPIAWQKEHKGMQGTEYLTDRKHENAVYEWLKAKDYAVEQASMMDNDGVTKQLCNRLLEPFMWHTVLISGTEWENFFELRCPQYVMDNAFDTETGEGIVMHERVYKSRKDFIEDSGQDESSFEEFNNDNINWLLLNKGQAEIHMMALAEAMWDAMNESTPKQLKAGEWHIPFEDKISNVIIGQEITGGISTFDKMIEAKVKISTAMAARTSYTVIGDEKEVSYETLLSIHDKMAVQVPFHASPFEHCAKAMSEEEYIRYIKGYGNNGHDGIGFDHNQTGWCRNYKGFIQYRHILEKDL